ncbi:MAG: cytochrome c biogenesis protein [Actinomycetia bacterium]|nr:cytochrome c biogenesis protein [Actinomycetes bacterium]
METLVRLAVLALLVAASATAVRGFYRPALEPVARRLLAAAFLVETALLGHAAVRLQGFPAVTVGSWVEFFVWMVLGVYLVGVRRPSWAALGGFVAPLVTVIWVGGELVDVPLTPALPRDLVGAWLVAHVALATAAYTAFLLASAAAVMYIEKERELRQKTPRLFYYRLPALADSDRWSRRWVAVGLPLLTAAMITGSVWSKRVLGVYWDWSPKEVWSSVTWAVYALYLLARRWGWGGHRAAWLSIWAFVFVAVNFLGVNIVFHGVHDYRGAG